MDFNALKQKLQRYAVTLPVDAFCCLLFWMLALFFDPRALFRNNPPSGSLQTRIASAVLLLILGAFPSRRRITELVRIFEHSRLPIFRWPFSFCSLPEKAERKLLNFFTPEIHHKARLQVIAKHLPPAQRILDLGGSCGGIPQGALLHMGYPHEPEEVVIVDLPPEIQFSSYKESTLSRPPLPAVHHHGKTAVRTVYTPMTDLSQLPAHSFDLVWSGQSIEHVTTEEAQRVFKEVARVLKPDGVFCLDTPNRHVSVLLTRVGMLHPEHKIEYTADELKRLAEALGFQVTATLGETILPFSRDIGRYCRSEALLAEVVSPRADDGLSFFLCCKPSIAT